MCSCTPRPCSGRASLRSMKASASSSILPKATRGRKPPGSGWLSDRLSGVPAAGLRKPASSSHQLRHLPVRAAALRAILADLLEQGPVGAQIQDRVARTAVDVAPPQEVRDHEEVVGPP